MRFKYRYSTAGQISVGYILKDTNQIFRKHAAILSTAVKAYRRLMGYDETATVETYSPKWDRPQSRINIMTSLRLSPTSVSEYSTFGGTSA